MQKNLPFLLTVFFSFFFQVEMWSQTGIDFHSQLKFRHITIDNGLTHNRVMSICEDRYGYIWIATSYGLNRYNGMEIKTYYHSIYDSLSLPSDVLYNVFCDSNGKIWIGTDEGLCVYNEFNDRFTKFDLKGLTSDNNDVFDILEDEKKHLWFATIRGLYLYMPESDSI